MQKKSIAGRKLLSYSPWLKRLLIMKMIAILILVVGLTSSYAESDAQTAKINLKFTNGTVKDILEEIEHQTNLSFMYDNDVFKGNRQISIEAENETLKSVVDKLISGENLKYEMVNRYIIITSAKEPTVNQQDKKVTGKVTDQTGASLPGASVVVKGTTTGVITDNNGNYSLVDIPENSTLQFSFVGMKSQEIIVGSKTKIDVTLADETIGLEEVVAVGYGTMKRSDITGSVSSIKASDFKEIKVTSAVQAIQGRVAGVDIVSTGTNPGSDVNIRIRGRRSFAAGNDPLFIVDGIPFAGGLNDINPQDINSMEVLKDASATAIYGSRGANGVVLITTNRGKEGKAVVSYDGSYGISSASGVPQMMNASEFAEARRQVKRYDKIYDDTNVAASEAKIFNATELESIASGRNTDWQNLILKTGVQQSHQLGVSGGNDQTKYAVSANYFGDKGIVEGLDFNRYTFRINIDQKIGKRVTVGASTLMTYSIQNGSGFGPFGTARTNNPLTVPYDADGNLIFHPLSTESLIMNPLNDLVPGQMIREDKRSRVFVSMFGEVKIMDGLTYRMNFGPDFQTRRRGEYSGSLTSARNGGDASAGAGNYNTFAYTLENILNYTKTFAQKHSLNFTGLYGIQRQSNESYYTVVQGVPIPTMEFSNLGAASTVTGYSSDYGDWVIQSYMARANYSYDNRYMVTLTARVDGSSRFAEGKKYGTFPSLALGWRISEENFMKNQSIFSNLKFRASYGQIGNTGIPSYSTLGNIKRSTYAFGPKGVYGYVPNNIVNPDLTWETTTSANIGLDFGLFKDRINGSIEVYQQQTKDLLLNRYLPITTGTSNVVLQNIGKTQNRGIEVNISTVNLELANGFKWTTDLNFYSNKEEIVDLYGDKKDDVGNGWFIGHPLTVFYDYKKIGIWQLGEETQAASYNQLPGHIRVADLAGKDANGNITQGADGKISAEDRVVLGSDVPKWSGGMTNRFAYRNFDFSFMIFTRQGCMIKSNLRYIPADGRFNSMKMDYWTEKNPTNEFPRTFGGVGTAYQSTLLYFDGSFVKVRNIQLGYNIPASVVSKLKLNSIRVYASANNPFIFAKYRSKYHGVDPEIAMTSSNGSERTAEVSSEATPSTQLVMFGINMKF